MPSAICRIFIVLAVLSLFIQSCGLCSRDKSEERKYESLKSGLKYRAYCALSKNSIPPLIKIYNRNRNPEQPEISEDVARLLLGYLWAVSKKPDFAIAESNMAAELGADEDMKFLSHTVISIAMYEKGWKSLAKEESGRANALLKKDPEDTSVESKVVLYHLVLGTASIYDGNFDAARFHFAGFSNATQIEWPYLLVDAMADIAEGKVQQGLTKMKKLGQDERLPEEVRTAINQTLADIESEAGPVDSRLFWPKVVSICLYRELGKVGAGGIDKIIEMIDELQEKMK